MRSLDLGRPEATEVLIALIIRHDDDDVGRGGLRTEEDRNDRTEDNKKDKGSFHGICVMGKSIEFLLKQGKKGPRRRTKNTWKTGFFSFAEA